MELTGASAVGPGFGDREGEIEGRPTDVTRDRDDGREAPNKGVLRRERRRDDGRDQRESACNSRMWQVHD